MEWNGIERWFASVTRLYFDLIFELSKSLLFPLLFLLSLSNSYKYEMNFLFMVVFFYWTYESKVVGVSICVTSIKKYTQNIFIHLSLFHISHIFVSITNTFCMLWIRLSMDLHKFLSKSENEISIPTQNIQKKTHILF